MTNTLIGHTINGRYRLESLLGDGGMGTVYRAYDVNLDRQVALKLMHAHFARQEEFRARLIQEARTAAQLDHPSVVQIFRLWRFSRRAFHRHGVCQWWQPARPSAPFTADA